MTVPPRRQLHACQFPESQLAIFRSISVLLESVVCAIYVEHVAGPFEVAQSACVITTAPAEIFFWHQPMWRSERAVAQQGLPSLSLKIDGRYEGLPDMISGNSHVRSDLKPAQRWLFSAQIKGQILKHLRVANITAQSLFPGLDGLGRSIGEAACIRRSLTQRIVGAHIPSSGRVG